MTINNLYDRFRASVARNADATALEVGELTVSYRQLQVAAERLSGRIQAAAGRTPHRLGLLTSRSLPSYAGYLGGLSLGAAVVPLNPAAPLARNLSITRDAGLDAVIVDGTSGENVAELAAGCSATIVDMSGGEARSLLDPRAETPQGTREAVTPGDIAYIVFTSGSTGTPKGVPVTHGNVLSYLDHVIPRYGFGPGARASQTFEISFDGSVIELFATWCSGAALCVPEKSEVLTPVRYVNARRLTHWMSVPSVISFARRLRALAPGSMPTLRWSLFGGEPLTMEQAQAWAAAAPHTRVENTYGPTELTCTCTGYPVPADPDRWPATSNGSLPIGDIFPHLEHVVIGDDGKPCDDGELCVRGPQRFPGYLVPRHNIGRFMSIRDGVLELYDGRTPLTPEHWYCTGDRIRREGAELVHIGRVDDQVKIRGYRVELGEVELLLRRHPAVEDVVVVAATAADGEPDLHAVYVGSPAPADELLALVGELPPYMRPRGFHYRGALPHNANGKIDRRRLAAELTNAAARDGADATGGATATDGTTGRAPVTAGTADAEGSR